MYTWLLMPDVKKSDRKVATTFCCRFKNKNTVNLCGDIELRNLDYWQQS